MGWGECMLSRLLGALPCCDALRHGRKPASGGCTGNADSCRLVFFFCFVLKERGSNSQTRPLTHAIDIGSRWLELARNVQRAVDLFRRREIPLFVKATPLFVPLRVTGTTVKHFRLNKNKSLIACTQQTRVDFLAHSATTPSLQAEAAGT